MSVPASKVKQVCSAAEAALVRNSRKPAIETLSAAQLKQNAVRARKLFDKWQGQARGQSRRAGRQTGASGKPANSELKMQIFREALDAFEQRLARFDGKGANKPAKSPSKKARTSEHRGRRAAIRKGMTAVEDLLNAENAAKAIAPTTPTPAEEPTEKPAKKTPKFKPPAVDKAKKAKPPASAQPQLKKETKSFAVAKQARVAASGRTTRFVGHITARGRRAQARRDSKNP